MPEFFRFQDAEGEPRSALLVTHQGLRDNPDDACRSAAVAMSPHLTDKDVLQLAAARGLSAGVVGGKHYNQAYEWVYKEAEINAEAMRDLGFKSAEIEEAPTAEDAIQQLGTAGLIALGRQFSLGRDATLMIMPSIREIGLFGDSNNPGIIPRYDRKEGRAKQINTQGLREVWGDVDDKATQHDPVVREGSKWVIAFMLGGGTRAGVIGSLDRFGEAGVVYDDMDTEDQRRMIQADSETDEYGSNFVVGAAGIGHYIWRCAQLRVKGHPLLDSRHGQVDVGYAQRQTLVKDPERDESKLTATNFVNYDDRKMKLGSTMEIPAARTEGGQIIIGRRPSSATHGAGVRRVLQHVASTDLVKA